jgi:cytochrome c oxidase cbb3-type subunit 1
MNPTENQIPSVGASEIDASCRVPLLALFGGAALWLVAGLALGLVAGIKFHAPDFLGACPLLTYGRVAPAADDLVLYGFCIPGALGVALWIFARLSGKPLALPVASVAAANLWHLGVFIGTAGILLGDSTGHPWMEYPRAAAVLLFAAFALIAISAAATFGWRSERSLYPSHWFLFAALLWFPWIFSTAALFLTSNTPPRGVVQSIIGWWFADNLLFVWLALAGIGIAFYFLPKIAGKPLASSGYALFAFFTLIFFATWCGIPAGAPVPAWLPALSSVAAALTLMPLLAIEIVACRTAWGSVKSRWDNGPYCFIGSGVDFFFLSGLMLVAKGCPQYSRVLDFTWFGVAQTQLQLLGFAAMILFGAIYELLPRVMGRPLPLPKFVKLHFWLALIGVLLFVVSLAVAGVEQGEKLANHNIAFADASAAALKFLRISTTGQLLILLGALLFAANLFVMTIQWKLGIVKSVIACIKAPLETAEVES